jgi:hypothetical protein
MSLRSALAGAAGTAAVLVALGNPAVVDAGRDEGSLLATSVTGFANWDVLDGSGEVAGFAALRLGVTIVVAGLLAGLAGRSRSRAAAWLAGWGAVVVGSAVGAAAGYVYLVPVVLDGRSFAATWADGLVDSADAGSSFGFWTGWLVGLAVAVATSPVGAWETAPHAAHTGPALATNRPTDPPPPWWAPTTGGTEAAVHPGPTAFPPGGFGPVVPGAGEPVPPFPAPRHGATHELTTASGDPHPSDPDATRAVGLPAERPAGGDPDATAVVEPRPGDHTNEVPRRDP